MKLKTIIAVLAAGHGLNDLVAGYFLGSIALDKTELVRVGLGLIIYNLLAFGGQYPVALLLEKAGSVKRFLLAGYGMNILAVALFPANVQFSIVLAGIGSAIYHVAGGSVCARDNKALNIGLFAAPGVAGLIAGGYLAYAQVHVGKGLLASVILYSILLSSLPLHTGKRTRDHPIAKDKSLMPDRHDLIMMLLLIIISLRSVIWNIFQLIHENNYYWLLAIGASAALGKILGGWLADRIGWRLYMMASLAAAVPLISFFRREMVIFCIGIGLLQSGIPSTTALLIESLKGRTERAIGLAFGSCIIAAAVIFYTPLRVWLFSDIAILIVAGSAVFLMYFVKRKTDRKIPFAGVPK